MSVKLHTEHMGNVDFLRGGVPAKGRTGVEDVALPLGFHSDPM